MQFMKNVQNGHEETFPEGIAAGTSSSTLLQKLALASNIKAKIVAKNLDKKDVVSLGLC